MFIVGKWMIGCEGCIELEWEGLYAVQLLNIRVQLSLKQFLSPPPANNKPIAFLNIKILSL